MYDHLARKTHVAEKQWQMQYYVDNVETGYMEDVQRLK